MKHDLAMAAMEQVSVNADLIEKVKEWLKSVMFLNYNFHVTLGHGGVYLQATYMDPDTYTQRQALQYTRKWLLSPQMTKSEVIQTAFKLCMTSMEHRTREAFHYQNRRIFGPHFDIDDLVKLCDNGRENAGGRS